MYAILFFSRMYSRQGGLVLCYARLLVLYFSPYHAPSLRFLRLGFHSDIHSFIHSFTHHSNRIDLSSSITSLSLSLSPSPSLSLPPSPPPHTHT